MTTLYRLIRDRADVLHADDVITPSALTSEYLHGHALAGCTSTITQVQPNYHPGITRLTVLFLSPGDPSPTMAEYHFPSSRIIPVLRPEYTE